MTVTFVRARTVFLRLVGHSRCHLNKKSKHQVQKQVALVLLVLKETGAWSLSNPTVTTCQQP